MTTLSAVSTILTVECCTSTWPTSASTEMAVT